ncbi:MAG: cytochrome c-type biogenesis protein CcmH [Limnohabitans sp.]|nr:cytochrome c-type biogenesis protein CcmH [Limnohabitans sp.]
MKRIIGAFVFILIFANTLYAREAQPYAEDPVVEARLLVLADELRCLVCQNESLASSRAELAEDLRREVRNLIRQGKTDAQIKFFLVERYGDFVLYRPEVKPITWILWFGPFLLLLIAVWSLWRYLCMRSDALLQHQQAKIEPLENSITPKD